MYLGTYKVGDDVTLRLQCVNGDMVATLPDEAPHAYVWSASGMVEALRVPIHDPRRLTGFFLWRLGLRHAYQPGNYAVVYRWQIGGVANQKFDVFGVVPGGNHDGQVLALHVFDRPDSMNVLRQVASGRIIRGRNPVIE